MSEDRDLTTGSVKRNLIELTGPMIIGIISILTFNLIDTYFIGQLGADQLAAISFTFPVVIFIISLAQGIGIGTMSVVSKSIGQGKLQRAALETTTGLILAMILVLIFSFTGIATIGPVFRMLGATDQTLPYIREYMEIWYIAVLFVIIPIVGNNAIRAAGDTKVPSYIMLVAVGVNLVLDPLLIFGYGPFPKLGIRGAAFATAISRAVTLGVAIYVLYYRERLISFRFGNLQHFFRYAGSILYIGLPTTGSKMINPIGIGIMTALVATFGQPAVAAFGVGFRIERFSLSVINALASVIGPFIGQNIGAEAFKRVRRAYFLSFRFSIGWYILISILIALLADPIARLFTDSEEVVGYLKLFLYIVPISYTLKGIFQIVIISLNTLKHPLHAAGLAVLQMMILSVPLAWLATRFLDAWAVFAAIGISYFLSGAAAWYVNRQVFSTVVDQIQGDKEPEEVLAEEPGK